MSDAASWRSSRNPDRAAFLALLDLSYDLTVLLEPSGRISYASPAALELLGHAPDEIAGVDFAHCLHPDDRAAVFAAVRETVATRRMTTTAARVQTADGSYRCLEFRAQDRTADPDVGGIAVVARDRTTEQSARDAAREVEEQLDALVDNTPVLVFVLDADGVFTFARGREFAEVGLDSAELLGRPIADLDGPVAEAVHDAALRCLDGEDVDLVVQVRDRQFDIRCRPRRQDGAVTGVLGMGVDMTATVDALQQVRTSEARWRALTRAGSDAALVVDRDAVIRFMSPAGPSLFGWNPEDTIGRSAFSFIHPDDAPAVRAALEAVLSDPSRRPVVEFRMATPTNTWRWAEVGIRNGFDDPAVRGIIGNIRDVSERHETREALAESEARYRLIVETTQDGILLIDADGRPTYVNDRACEVAGVSRERLMSRPSELWLDPRAQPLVEAARQRRSTNWVGSYEVPYRRPDGEDRYLRITTTPLHHPEPDGGLLALVSDITDRKRAEDELARLALHDGLTGLPNRGLLLDRIAGALARRRRHGGIVALLLLDVDQFHSVNESVGAGGADDLLRQFTSRLERTVRAGDTVARLGSDEFAVLSEELEGEADATLLADRLLAVLAEPVTLPGRSGPVEAVVTASIGVALTTSDTVRPEDLVQRSELAMHRAKSRGRACYDVLSDAGEQHAVDRLRVVNELRAGLRRGEMELHYQPLVELATGRVIGAEALARWQHPERGLLGPEEFIALAEGSGLIRELGAWVLRTACRQAVDPAFRRATAPAEPLIAVNLSTQQLTDPRLSELVGGVLAETGLPPHRLVLEVTETALLADTTAALEELEALRRLGVQLALDDFGTGFSSLTYLKRFPLHELKIDRSFVAEYDVDPASQAIVASVIQLARAIGLSVVAEGVETEQQRQWLLDLGCTLGQGYLFGRPVPADQF